MADEPGVERRLAAILAADVVGYSRLMEADEAGTHARLKAVRKELLEPAIARQKGRIVKLTGDGVLVEFPSAVGAVLAATEIQRAVAKHERDRPAEERLAFRIGINLGDVIIESDDIYGDGVNVAARLENLVEPGGICITRNVYNQVEGKFNYCFEYLGERRLRNIKRPVQTYRVHHLAAPGSDATPVPPLPEKPVVAVLPFANLSGDPQRAYFSEGVTEDVITELARF
jgi:adenylate cyclase